MEQSPFFTYETAQARNNSRRSMKVPKGIPKPTSDGLTPAERSYRRHLDTLAHQQETRQQ